MVLAAEPATSRVDTFAAFYRRELPVQVRRATLLAGDAQTAQDVVHDAFAEVYARWDSLRDPGP